MPIKGAPEAELARLNAPYGAPCFLTGGLLVLEAQGSRRLNAPYGAPCFLTRRGQLFRLPTLEVLMHLMALRAF